MPPWCSVCMYQRSLGQSFPCRTPPSRMACGKHTAGLLCHKLTPLCCGWISFPPANSQLRASVQRQQRQPLVANNKAAMQANPRELRNCWCQKALRISTLSSKRKSTVAHRFFPESHLGNANGSPQVCVPFSPHSGVTCCRLFLLSPVGTAIKGGCYLSA